MVGPWVALASDPGNGPVVSGVFWEPYRSDAVRVLEFGEETVLGDGKPGGTCAPLRELLTRSYVGRVPLM
jgi:hypothetical protein